jgi:hypothetical protein
MGRGDKLEHSSLKRVDTWFAAKMLAGISESKFIIKRSIK